MTFTFLALRIIFSSYIFQIYFFTLIFFLFDEQSITIAPHLMHFRILCLAVILSVIRAAVNALMGWKEFRFLSTSVLGKLPSLHT